MIARYSLLESTVEVEQTFRVNLLAFVKSFSKWQNRACGA